MSSAPPPVGPPTMPPPSVPRGGRRQNRESLVGLDGLPQWTRLEIFHGLPSSTLENLRDAMEPVYFDAGQEIIVQGETGEQMFVLEQGSVKVRVQGKNKSTVFQRVLTSPALFGEMSLITAEKRSASVVAETRSRCLKLNREGFNELMRRNPQAAVFLTKIVGERLLEAGSIKNVGKYEVRGRLGSGAVATVF